MTGVAVKVTDAPEQIVNPGFALSVTEGISTGLTVMFTGFEIAGFPEVHVSLEVSVTVT